MLELESNIDPMFEYPHVVATASSSHVTQVQPRKFQNPIHQEFGSAVLPKLVKALSTIMKTQLIKGTGPLITEAWVRIRPGVLKHTD